MNQNNNLPDFPVVGAQKFEMTLPYHDLQQQLIKAQKKQSYLLT